jgi:hypothetical protein
MIKKLPEARPITSPTADVETYCRIIWEEHCKRRGNEFPLMSSAEFSLVMGWHESGIPLRIVLRGFMDTEKAGSSLFYYRSPVEQAYRMWVKAVGQLV